MQSFAPMRVVAFSGSTLNEVYIPTNIMWLEGSDLDIDKQYILGYTISNSGRIYRGQGNHHQEDRLKNNVVENIWRTVTDPRNQINLTQPISTDDMKALSAKSTRGSLADKMSYYNPAHKYSMQVENMVGRDCIGNVATALKGFFALTYMYNKRMDQLIASINGALQSENPDFTEAISIYKRYFLKPLANVNADALETVISKVRRFNSDFADSLSNLRDTLYDQEDMSMLMGQLLNAATDNAKELILKKINADANWIDMYTSAFMVGESLDSVGNFMLSPVVETVIEMMDASVLERPKSKLKFLDALKETINMDPKTAPDALGVILQSKLQDKQVSLSNSEIENQLEIMKARAEAAEETRILGRFLKINQGLYTKRAEMASYLSDIVSFVENQFLKQVPGFEILSKLLRALSGNFVSSKKIADIESIIKKDPSKYGVIPPRWLNIGWLKSAEYRREVYSEVKQRLDAIISNSKFDIYAFASDELYKSRMIEKYESSKVQFNILEAVAESPHFSNMFKMVAVNKEVLTSLSTRNKLEGLVIDKYTERYRGIGGSKLSTDTVYELQDRVDEVLRKE